jgi:parallel beta-helix repeat protein
MFATALVLAAALLAMAPSAAPAQSLACAQVITEDTTLHADLGPCPGDGLVIGARNVTLDLNGHAIVGDATGEDAGVRDEGHNRVVVENGEIHGFFTAVKLDAADGSRVSHMTETITTPTCCMRRFVQVLDSRLVQIENNFSDSGLGDEDVFVVSGSRNLIRGNVAHGPGQGDSFVISGSHNSIRGNTALLPSYGFMRIDGSKNRVKHNHVEAVNGGFSVRGARNLIAANSVPSSDSGLEVSGPGNVIRGNVVGRPLEPSLTVGGECRKVKVKSNDFLNGMELNGCRRARIKGNTLSAEVEGISLRGGSDNTVKRNTITDAYAGIIALGDSEGALVRRNTFSGGSWGIMVVNGSDNSIERNTVSQTDHSGIFVGGGSFETGPSVGTIVSGNLVTRAGFNADGSDDNDGIHVEDPGTTIANNDANDNADYGIQAVPGVIDGGGNTAVGNGNPLQCLNVACS